MAIQSIPLPVAGAAFRMGRLNPHGGRQLKQRVFPWLFALLALAGIVWLAARIYAGGILQSSKVGFLTAYRRSRDVR